MAARRLMQIETRNLQRRRVDKLEKCCKNDPWRPNSSSRPSRSPPPLFASDKLKIGHNYRRDKLNKYVCPPHDYLIGTECARSHAGNRVNAPERRQPPLKFNKSSAHSAFRNTYGKCGLFVFGIDGSLARFRSPFSPSQCCPDSISIAPLTAPLATHSKELTSSL